MQGNHGPHCTETTINGKTWMQCCGCDQCHGPIDTGEGKKK